MKELITPSCFWTMVEILNQLQDLYGCEEFKVYRGKGGELEIVGRPYRSTHLTWQAEGFAGPLLEDHIISLNCWYTLAALERRYRQRKPSLSKFEVVRDCLYFLSKEDKALLVQEILKPLSPHEQLELPSEDN